MSMESLNNSNMQDIVSNITKGFNKQLEEAFIEGLKRKGFEFKDELSLIQFIKNHFKN